MDAWNTFSFPFGAFGLFSVAKILVSGSCYPLAGIRNRSVGKSQLREGKGIQKFDGKVCRRPVYGVVEPKDRGGKVEF